MKAGEPRVRSEATRILNSRKSAQPFGSLATLSGGPIALRPRLTAGLPLSRSKRSSLTLLPQGGMVLHSLVVGISHRLLKGSS
jgi:hypothetical protein